VITLRFDSQTTVIRRGDLTYLLDPDNGQAVLRNGSLSFPLRAR